MYQKLNLNSLKGLLMLMLVISFPALTKAQDVTISIPDSSAIAGEEILLPINVSEILEADEVVSGSFEFSLNQNIFEIIGFEKTNTLVSNSDVLFNSGTNRLAFAGTNNIVGSGVLVYLRVRAKATANYFQSTDINFISASLNEGSPSVITENANLRIKGISIQPRSSISVLEGDSLQFNLSGDFVEPITWSSTDTSVAVINQMGLLEAKISGLIRVRAEDAQGLKDSTALFRIQPLNFQDLSISIPDTSVRQTKSVSIPVLASDLTGLEILSNSVEISYNFSALELLGVTNQNTLTSPWGEPTTNFTDGNVSIASAGTDTLVGSGALYYLNFRVRNNATGSSNISMNSATFNEDLGVSIQNGQFIALSAPEIFTSQQDTTISIGDTLNFEVTESEGTAPYLWTVNNEALASIGAETGVFQALQRGEVLVSAVDADDFQSEITTVTINDFDAWLDTLSVNYPDTVEIQLLTPDLSAFSLLSYSAQFQYDTSRVEFIGLNSEGTRSEGLSIQTRQSGDSLTIAAAGTSALSGVGAVIKLQFKPKDAVQNGERIKIDLLSLEFDEPSANVPTFTPLPGFIDIIRVNPPVAPTLSSPVNNSVNTDTTLGFQWGDVTNADQYRIQLSEENTFTSNTVDSVGNFTELTVRNLGFSSTYFWRVQASNLGGESEWSEVFTFTTTNGFPGIVSLVSPDNESVNIPLESELKWNTATLAETYQIQLSEASDFSSFVLDSMAVSDTLVAVSLEYQKNYFWRVRAENAQGISAEWSEVFSFSTVPNVPEVVQLLQPTDGFTGADTSATFRWSSSATADSFRVEIASDENFTTDFRSFSTVDTTQNIGGLSFATTYYWRVNASNITGESGYSSVFSFKTRDEESENLPVVVSNPMGSISLDEDFGDSLVVNISDVFTDPEGAPLSFAIVEFSSELFEASLSGNNLRLTSLQDLFGNGIVVISATDNVNQPVLDTLSVEILSINDLPQISALPDTLRFNNNEELTFSLENTITDVEDSLEDLIIDFVIEPSAIIVDFDEVNLSATLSAPGFAGEGLLTLTVTDTDGGIAEASVVIIVEVTVSNEIDSSIPINYGLSQNYPNPFNPTTNISFDVPQASNVRLEVFDMLGRKVASLVNERKSAGSHTVTFDASNLSSGMYIYRMEAGSFVNTRKLMLIK